MQTVYSQVDDVTLGSSLRLLEGLGIMRHGDIPEPMCKVSRKMSFNSSTVASGDGHNQCCDSRLMATYQAKALSHPRQEPMVTDGLHHLSQPCMIMLPRTCRTASNWGIRTHCLSLLHYRWTR